MTSPPAQPAGRLRRVPFCHLHCHTDCSFLDGVGRPLEYAVIASAYGHTHLAITDHGNLHGLPAHARACERVGITPVFGCEMYVADTRGTDQDRQTITGKAKREKLADGTLDPTFTDAHLVLLAQSQEGLTNLFRLNHDAVTNGFYSRPRTTTDLVLEHSEGLFATTACIGSHFGQLALLNRRDDLVALMGRYRDSFGDRFAVELHINENPDQGRVNLALLEAARLAGVGRVTLASDVHYACRSDCCRQDEMIAVSRHVPVSDPKAFRLTARELWLGSAEDIYSLSRKLSGYGGHDSQLVRRAAAESVEIARSCSARLYPSPGLKPPVPVDGAGDPIGDPNAEVERLAREGLASRFGGGLVHARELRARLEHELAVIRKCDMASFYLVTADICRFCRSAGIFRWTRGSGCASLVAACLGITDVDPVHYRLLFERFVDPDRPNAPDFDLDIDSSRREEVIQFVRRRYGGPDGTHVARILALHSFGLKGALRDVLFQAHGLDRSLMDPVSKLADEVDPVLVGALGDSVPVVDDPKDPGLAEAVRGVSSRVGVQARADAVEAVFSAMVSAASGRVVDLLREKPGVVRSALEHVGRVKGRGQHAAGFVVAPFPVHEAIPLDRVSGEITTAWGEGENSQDIGPSGLMKIDLLGLEACQTIARTVRVASVRSGRPVAEILASIDPIAMDYSDPRVLAEFASGDGTGLHQLAESHGQLALLVKRLRPTSVNDIIAAVALYRPGSMDHLEEFVARSRGEAVVPSLHPLVDPVLADTKGVVVYQEQVMSILHLLGGLALRDAYSAIKAISKKDLSKLTGYREKFLQGAASRKVPDAENIWSIVEKFAGYGFNRAHATSYGVLSWITAKLRAEYPVEFYSSVLSSTANEPPKDKRHDRKIVVVMRSAARRGIVIQPPTVGLSGDGWGITRSGQIVAPLSLVPGIGAKASPLMIAWAKANPRATLDEFLQWVADKKPGIPGAALKKLAESGSLSRLCPSITQAYDLVCAFIETAIKGEVPKGSTRLAEAKARVLDGRQPMTHHDEETIAGFELRALEFNYWRDRWTIEKRGEKADALVASGRAVDSANRDSRGKRRAYLVRKITKIKDRRGNEMAFISLEGRSGDRVDAAAFSSVWSGVKAQVREGCAYLVLGDFDSSGRMSIAASRPGYPNPLVDIDSIDGAKIGVLPGAR